MQTVNADTMNAANSENYARTSKVPLKASKTASKKLLIVDDDAVLLSRLERAMAKRGFDVVTANSCTAATGAMTNEMTHALVDMRLGDGHGLDILPALRRQNPNVKVVMLTGYGNIASTVAAIKAGAADYLTKPADPDAIEQALLNEDGEPLPPPPADPMPADRVRWEHIQRVYEQCGRNVSETARRLKMHRRTLQRILNKHAPPE